MWFSEEISSRVGISTESFAVNLGGDRRANESRIVRREANGACWVHANDRGEIDHRARTVCGVVCRKCLEGILSLWDSVCF